jgi:hypothetical protein
VDLFIVEHHGEKLHTALNQGCPTGGPRTIVFSLLPAVLFFSEYHQNYKNRLSIEKNLIQKRKKSRKLSLNSLCGTHDTLSLTRNNFTNILHFPKKKFNQLQTKMMVKSHTEK